MNFLNHQDSNKKIYYTKLLKVLGSLSNLFANSETPYLNYRISENLFCKAFNAKNLSRSDVSADASKNGIGLGIKTFIEGNQKTWQKVAEFNKDRDLYIGATPAEIVKIISHLRNKRIEATYKIHKLEKLYYHCVVRKPGKMKVYETSMDLIQEDSFKNIDHQGNTIKFIDGLNEYSFNLSKSTLYKRFDTPNEFLEIDVQILKDPFDTLENLLEGKVDIQDLLFEPVKKGQDHVFLPLYSDKTKNVEKRSGLNQWNAHGRKRHPNEAYIPIPKWVHKSNPDFFPLKDDPFDLELPDGSIISARVCQEGGKALMSNPNKDLGQWILRDVLDLKLNELLTAEKLIEIGLDSVVIYKKAPNKFSINFTKIGTYEDYKEKLTYESENK